MIKKIFAIVLCFFIVNLFGQTEVIIKKDNKNYSIPAFVKNNSIYLSAKKYAEVFNIPFSENGNKITIGENKKLIFSMNNPYFSFIQNEDAAIYQLPLLPYINNNSLYLPFDYSINYLIKLSDNYEIEIDKVNKVLIAKSIKKVEENKNSKDAINSNVNINSHYNISALEIDEKANGTLIKIVSNSKITSYKSSYRKNLVTLVLKGVKLDEKYLKSIKGKGIIQSIEGKNFKDSSVIRFKVTDDYKKGEVIYEKGTYNLLLTFFNKKFGTNIKTTKNDKRVFDTIVIDAGHGGQDYGAIGVNGVKEKDVNLDVALKLGKYIEKNMSDVKVVYTRSKDVFVELYKRGKIANEKGGKLFISIHCNSTPEKPSNATGFEVYLLRPGRTQEAIKIAERENSVIKYESNTERYKKLTDENFILVSMAQSAYMKYSEKVSEILDREFTKDLDEQSRGIKQAGFYVLVGASMPSILIETGFLSNKNDASYLGSNKGRSEIAESIYKGVKSFKEYYNQQIDVE